MDRRKFVVGLGALASGSAAAVGTGAFTSVSANRNVSVNVTDDANAYLSLRATNDPNGIHVEQSSDGEVMIDVGDSGNDGDGVNPNAVTEFDDLIAIRNKGTQDVWVWAEDNNSNDATLLYYPSNRQGQSFEGSSNAQKVPVGGGPTKLGLEVDTTQTSASQISETFTIRAEASDPNSSNS